MFPKLQLRLVFRHGGAVIPKEELDRTEEADGLGKLACVRGGLVDLAVVVAERVIRRCGDHTREKIRENLLVRRTGLVSADAL